MEEFFVNFIIVSCLFNIPYYWFNWEEKTLKYIKEVQESMIKEMERRDPFHPLLKDLRSRPLGEIHKDLENKPLLKLIRDMLFFPINLVLMVIIVIDKLVKK